jgi:phenylpropionate dioxygenase-like ring-hydroxylating dioxygenase large terminal subunit
MKATVALRLVGPDWARALKDPATFEREQQQLSHVWTLLGLTTDVPRDGDWIRAALGGRSVFVQRFGDTLRGFENRCAHRFYPLRTADNGNGPIRCGFHHWQYDRDGRAIGIPKCQEMIGVTPRELDARLAPIEVETCGTLIFGRFPRPQDSQTLEQFLGVGFAILQTMFAGAAPAGRMLRPFSANWKLCYHISIEEYHIVAVHPNSFGKGGYLRPDHIHYSRFGWHSAFFLEDETVERMAERFREGTYRPVDYRVLHFFPNLVVSQVSAARDWYLIVQQFVPVGPDRTRMRGWSFRAPFQIEDRNWFDRLIRRAVTPLLPFGVRYYWSRILKEDDRICRRMQEYASQLKGSPLLTRQEERIGWFEEAYEQLMAIPAGNDVPAEISRLNSVGRDRTP